MNYLVTGGTGFIGIKVLKLLVESGDKVVAYDVLPDLSLLSKLLGEEKSSEVTVVQGDINDLAHIIRVCKDNKIEKIIHMASLLGSASTANPLLAVRVNCEGTVNILETARILGLSRVVLVSSVAVFGTADKYEQEYLPNDAPHYPTNIYGACKSFNEVCANQYYQVYGIDSIVIRFPAVYGEGQKRGLGASIAEDLFINPALGKPGKVPCGDDINNWLYVDDAARALVLASKVGNTRTRAFTVHGDVRSFAEMAQCIKDILPEAEIKLLPGRTGYSSKFDTRAAKEELGFEPEWPVEEGIKKIIQFVQQEKL